MTHAVTVDHVTKSFRSHSDPAKALKDRILGFRHNTVSDFVALDDVSFTVEPGETLGLLGHNGSGKSTLLKCIAGTLRPSAGAISVQGRVAAMLELGAGFHPDLTGRENVYLNGSILGFPKAHIEEIYDEIVQFSELETFMDTQVKYFSSGMYARLGFAVAVNLRPDILLIDEVLAVGDETFQRKCLERVRTFQQEGRTIILVTHAADQIRQVCDRAAVLHHGSLIFDGAPDRAIAAYRHAVGEETGPEPGGGAGGTDATSTSPLRISSVSVPSPDAGYHQPGDPIDLLLGYECVEQIVGVRARVIVHAFDGLQFVNASTFDLWGHDFDASPGAGLIRFRIEDQPFMDGRYLVSFVLQRSDETETFDRSDQTVAFEVISGLAPTARIRLGITAVHEPPGSVSEVAS